MPNLVCQDTNSGWKYHFDIKAKGQGHRGHEYMRHIFPWWKTNVPNMVWLCHRTKKLWPNIKPCWKPCKFDLEVKGKPMKVHDTPSHGYRPICQIWYANVKAKKGYRPDTNLHRKTERRMDRQTDRVIPISPPPRTLFSGGIIMHFQSMSLNF